MVSPWLLQFAANMNAMWTHVVLGVLVTAVSAWALWDYRRMHMYDREKGEYGPPLQRRALPDWRCRSMRRSRSNGD